MDGGGGKVGLELAAPRPVLVHSHRLVDCVQSLVVNHKQAPSLHLLFGIKHILELQVCREMIVDIGKIC